MPLEDLDAILWGSNKEDVELTTEELAENEDSPLTVWMQELSKWVSWDEWDWRRIEKIFDESRKRRGLKPTPEWQKEKALRAHLEGARIARQRREELDV